MVHIIRNILELARSDLLRDQPAQPLELELLRHQSTQPRVGDKLIIETCYC